MKKRFFKKLKKIILTLSCILSCLVIFTISVSAESNIDFLISSGNMTIQGISFGVPGLSGASSSGVQITQIMDLNTLINSAGTVDSSSTNVYKNASYIYDRLEITTPSEVVFLEKGSSFNGMISGFSSEWFFNGNTEIVLNSNVDISFICYFRDSSTKEYFSVSPSSFSFSDSFFSFKFNNVPCNTNFIILELRYSVSDFNLKNGSNTLKSLLTSGTFNYHAFRFVNFKVDFESSTLPVSEQPNYSQPSSGSASELEQTESELVGSTNSAAQEEINKSFNISFDLIQQWAYPISAFRDAFNYFVNSHNAVYTICIITLVIGVFLLFSNFVPRGRDK